MAYSVEYKTSVAGADGTENLAAITFDYLKKSQIEVRVSNAGETLTAFKTRLAADSVSALTYPSQYTINADKVITLAAAVLANGSTYQIEVRRNTGLTTNGVDYTDGATVTEANLDDSQTHLRQMVQELEDNKVTLLEDGTIAANTSGSSDTVVNLGTHNVTELSDVTDAGSGAVITSSERTKLDGLAQSDWNSSSGGSQILNKPTIPSGIDDLSDVSTSGVSSGQVLKWNGSAWAPQNDLTGSGEGASTFVGLSDTPSSFTAGKWLKVNSLGNAIEETNAPTSGISDVVSDTTPQLGGSLDVQANEINTSTSNGNIVLNPDGTGCVEVKGVGATTGAAGAIQLNCSNNNHGVKIQSPAHSSAASYTLTLPTDVGSSGDVLTTDGTTDDAALSWTTPVVYETANATIVKTGATDQKFTKGVRGDVATVTIAANVATCDLEDSNNFAITLQAAASTEITFSNLNAASVGQNGTITLTHAGGATTFGSAANLKWEGGTSPNVNTTGVDVIAYYVESTSRVSAVFLGNMS